MKPGNEVDEWGGSVWEERTPEERKREDGLEDLVKKVSECTRVPENVRHFQHPTQSGRSIAPRRLLYDTMYNLKTLNLQQ